MVGDGGKDAGPDLCLLELSRAEKVSAQDGVLVGFTIFLESLGYGIRNGGFPGASLTGQPEDTRAGRCAIVSPFRNIF